jgi:hypothetical protein
VKTLFLGKLVVLFPTTTLGTTVDPRIEKLSELLTGTTAMGATS